jgi:hypothetical protein
MRLLLFCAQIQQPRDNRLEQQLMRSSPFDRTAALLTATLLTLLLAASLSAQSVTDTIVQRERAKLQAEHTGTGFDELYHPEYEGVNQRGQVRTFGPGSTFQTAADPKFVLEEPLRVQVYESAAVVTGVQAPGGVRRVRFVRLWVKVGRDWRIAVHQGTAIGEAQPTALALAATPPPTGLAPALTAEEAAVLRVHSALVDAYAHDASASDRWTAPEFVNVTVLGQVVRREYWMKDIIGRQNKRLPSVVDEVTTRIFGDVAVIMFRNVDPRIDNIVVPRERVIRILAKKDGVWKQVLTQSTMIREATPGN